MIKQIGQYYFKLQDEIGAGSFSKVYRGWAGSHCAPRAIKVVDKKMVARHRLQSVLGHEVSIFSSVSHPNIVRLQKTLESDNNMYLIMEYCSGQTLRQKLRGGRLGESEVWHILSQICEAVFYLVRNGVIHRDIKPDNILLTKEGEVKLMDFGFACLLDQGEDTVLRDIMGSPLYMAPQLLLGKPYSPRSEIWSIGVLAYELLYGVPPWPAKSEKELLSKIMNSPLDFPPGASSRLMDLIEDCLQVREERRLGFRELEQRLAKSRGSSIRKKRSYTSTSTQQQL